MASTNAGKKQEMLLTWRPITVSEKMKQTLQDC